MSTRAIVLGMTAAHEPIPAIPPLPTGAGPAAIRAGLLPEERGEFDQAYRRALTAAAETLDLTGVFDMLEGWRQRAILSANPETYRRALARAAATLSGNEVPSDASLADLKAQLRQLGA
jgi:hypothetical protein